MAESPRRPLALHWKILIGMALGILVGLVLNEHGGRITGSESSAVRTIAGAVVSVNKFLGDLFVSCLRFVAVPIVLFSLIAGAAGLGDLRRLGRIGGRTVAFYTATTAMAIVIGLALALAVRPGAMVSPEARDRLAAQYASEAATRIEQAEKLPGLLDQLLGQVLELVPRNPFEALATANMLQVIFVALVVGIGLTMLPRAVSEPVLRLCEAMTEVLVRFMRAVMWLAPVAVFALLAPAVAAMGPDILGALLAYALVLLGGLGVLLVVEYPLLLRLVGRISPARFFQTLAPAQVLAFSSSSSSATLPVTMRCVRQLGVSEEVTSFVCPLGATINMDGTAMYQGVATVFIAQMYGIDLSLPALLTIVLTATLASIGTPGIPGAGVVMLVVVLESVGVPPEGIAVILGVDRLLDMCRTVVNVTGDAVTSVLIARWEGERLEPTP
jgi:proton glutamate symport protein